MNHINDLRILLSAIYQQREVYKLRVDEKYCELTEQSGMDSKDALKTALLTTDAKAEYEKLLNLYACLGMGSGEYAQSLKKVAS